MSDKNPLRGEFWLIDLNPIRGHEQGGKRPALIFSVDIFNSGPAELVVVIPVTTRDKKIPMQVRVLPPEGGLKEASFIKCEDIRSISKDRLVARLGSASRVTLQAVELRIRTLLNL